MNRWRTIAALALGTIFAAAAGYWFTIGRRPLTIDGDFVEVGPDEKVSAS